MKTFVLVVATVVAGCSTVQNNPRTAAGAGAGAATGAVVGGVLGGGKGAVAGGVIGAAAGGVAGHILDRQAKELKEKDINASRTASGILVKLKEDLLFETGSAVLKPEAMDELGKLGDVLVKYPQDRIQIMGFTDSTGSEQFNQDLSNRRAEAVRKVLMLHGLKDEQAVAIGMGEQSPIATNDTVEGRSKNRRVELHIAVAK